MGTQEVVMTMKPYRVAWRKDSQQVEQCESRADQTLALALAEAKFHRVNFAGGGYLRIWGPERVLFEADTTGIHRVSPGSSPVST
jgi:hypothetical protein